jgi:lysine 6-dehydrogenase
MKIIVLGAGLIGKTIAVDLNSSYDVTCADINEATLHALSEEYNVKTITCNFRDQEALIELIRPFDLVVGSVPGFMGFETLKTIIKAGKNVADISFFPEDAFELDDLAKEHNVTAVVDCGVAPGMCNIIAGYHDSQSKLVYYECLVGGLPVLREWPFEYKAVFSPIDVVEEYIRPARYVEGGQIVTREALSDPEYINFENLGTLESFNTDGLRSLIKTMPHVPDMKEKTLRYPGHIELMRVFRETGFFDKEKIEVDGHAISPLALTARLLFPKWKLKKNDEDFTIMRVTVSDGVEKNIYTLLDRYDPQTQTSSMARTTGYTCAAIVKLMAENKFTRKGICPPEYVGAADNCFVSMLDYLAARGVHYVKETTAIKPDC